MPVDPAWFIHAERRLRPDGGALWHDRLRREIADRLKDVGRPVLLDAGCGTASLVSLQPHRRPALRVGLDLDPRCVCNRDIDCFARASALYVPFRDSTFDVVISSYLLEHLTAPLDALLEFHRVLKPGGMLYLWTPNRWNYAMIVASLTPTGFHNWFRSFSRPHLGRENDPVHYRANTAGRLARLAAEAGFVPTAPVEFGAGAYSYFRFSKLLFTIAALGSALLSRTPLQVLKSTLVLRAMRPAPAAPASVRGRRRGARRTDRVRAPGRGGRRLPDRRRAR